MISKVLNGKEYLFVEVPEDAYDFEVYNTYQKEIRYFFKGCINPLTGGEKIGVIPLRKFCKTLDKISFFKASELTEDHWKVIVELIPQQEWDTNNLCRYKPYEGVMPYSYAKSSGLSLISSLNLKPETTLIIQKQ